MKPPCLECELRNESKNNPKCLKCEARERYWTEMDERIPTQDWNMGIPLFRSSLSRRAAE